MYKEFKKDDMWELERMQWLALNFEESHKMEYQDTEYAEGMIKILITVVN